MLTNKQIVEAFADGETDGKSNSMFIQGDVIYSYGYHFPMAVRGGYNEEGDLIIYFNNDRYSVTTSCHQGLLKRALGRAEIRFTDTSGMKVISRTPEAVSI